MYFVFPLSVSFHQCPIFLFMHLQSEVYKDSRW